MKSLESGTGWVNGAQGGQKQLAAQPPGAQRTVEMAVYSRPVVSRRGRSGLWRECWKAKAEGLHSGSELC